MNTRLEHDLLGDAPVPSTAYSGVHTMRAIENYPITGKQIGRASCRERVFITV